MGEVFDLLRAFAFLAGYVAGAAAVFALLRHRRRLILALLGTLVVAGAVLLGWTGSQGIWAETGRIHAGSPQAKAAFLVGLPVTSLGSALFLIGLFPLGGGWWSETSRGRVADIGLRVVGTWIASSVIGVVLYTVVTGYNK